jgi:hypothetical protein
MADDSVLARPGKKDINGQFTAGKMIRKTKRIYDALSRNGDYQFGELTAFFYGYDVDEAAAWQVDIKMNYPQDVIDKIKKFVIEVLDKVDPKDKNTPISLEFKWDQNGNPNAVLTQTGDAHTITIYGGLKEPVITSFVDRPKTKSP